MVRETLDRLVRWRTLGAAALAAVVVAVSLPATATHGDGTYEQPVWFTRSQKHLDVLIVPAEHGQVINGNGLMGGNPVAEANPCANSYTVAMRQSTLDWNAAIQQFGPAWLKNGLTISIYVAGCDLLPQLTPIHGYHIVIFSDQTKLNILGIAITTGSGCFVDNSKFFVTSLTYNDMYNINAQEYGHCLGLEHVGGDHPAHDVMDGSYDDTPGSAATHRHCISNLNVKGLEGVFATTFGQPGGGQTAVVPVSGYTTMAC